MAPREKLGMVPAGGELSGANGVDVSKDGKHSTSALVGCSLACRADKPPSKRHGASQLQHRQRALGTGWVAVGGGAGGPNVGDCFRSRKCDENFTGVAKIDPTSLKWREIVRYPANDVWLLGTTALEVGKEVWVGTVSGNRIARFQLR